MLIIIIFCVMNSTEISSLALGLTESWYVENVSFNLESDKRILYIKISYKKAVFLLINWAKVRFMIMLKGHRSI